MKWHHRSLEVGSSFIKVRSRLHHDRTSTMRSTELQPQPPILQGAGPQARQVSPATAGPGRTATARFPGSADAAVRRRSVALACARLPAGPVAGAEAGLTQGRLKMRAAAGRHGRRRVPCHCHPAAQLAGRSATKPCATEGRAMDSRWSGGRCRPGGGWDADRGRAPRPRHFVSDPNQRPAGPQVRQWSGSVSESAQRRAPGRTSPPKRRRPKPGHGPRAQARTARLAG